jgi:hypothetical protein
MLMATTGIAEVIAPRWPQAQDLLMRPHPSIPAG